MVVLARQEKGPGLNPLDLIGFIQGSEGSCSLRKTKTSNGKSNGKNNGKGTQFWLLTSHPSLEKSDGWGTRMLELGEGRTDNSRSNGKKQIPLGMTNNRTGNGNGNSNDNSNDNGNDSLTSGLSAEVY